MYKFQVTAMLKIWIFRFWLIIPKLIKISKKASTKVPTRDQDLCFDVST